METLLLGLLALQFVAVIRFATVCHTLRGVLHSESRFSGPQCCGRFVSLACAVQMGRELSLSLSQVRHTRMIRLRQQLR